MAKDYQEFLAGKRRSALMHGVRDVPELNPALYPFQRSAVEFLLRVGRGAAFLNTGLGKTLCQLEWARVVVEETGQPVIVLSPLAVAQQTKREAEKFGIDACVVADGSEVTSARIYITNYEKLDRFDVSRFGGVVLDESSILKGFQGATRKQLTEAFSRTRFRLCCTATPAPNDHMEIGNHAEFLSVMNAPEMLSRWFVNDTSEASQSWRLKGHAVDDFWDWVCSWSRCVGMPSDLGAFDDSEFVLPKLETVIEKIDVDWKPDVESGTLFRINDVSATDLHREKRRTVEERADRVAALVAAEPHESWVIWCNTDNEADALKKRIEGAVEVRGSMPAKAKEDALVAFSTGAVPYIITKPSIAGFGLNWQHCARMAFVGLTFSFEEWFQAVRRCWRFGQTREVRCHVIVADTETNIYLAIKRKERAHNEMLGRMRVAARRSQLTAPQKFNEYKPEKQVQLPAFLKGE